MGGKHTDGFTKSAQKLKFIRHRDIKMKESELKKEAHIRRVMCEGVCTRCREKVLWRFKYDKYKPLKTPGKCQTCKNKTVTKAYRTLCDTCAAASKSCASCCRNILEANASDMLDSSKNTLVDGNQSLTGEMDIDRIKVKDSKALDGEESMNESEEDDEDEEKQDEDVDNVEEDDE
jgi:hypothetical protein